MSTAFDHDRAAWYGTDGPVTSSSGGRRRKITPVSRVVIHYTGAGSQWTDLGDTAQEIRNIQAYAAGAGKPWEYNVVIDSAAETWEYAGEFMAAHNGSGNASGQFGNSDSLAFLCLYGLDNLTPQVADKFVEGIRKALRQAINGGLLYPQYTIKRHGDVRRGGTACPGPIGQTPYWERIVAPLNLISPPRPIDPTPAPIIEPPTEDEDMLKLCTIWIDKTADGQDAHYLVGPGGVAHLDGRTYQALKSEGVREIEGTNTDVAASYRRVARGLPS